MSAKVFIVTADDQVHQIGGTWWDTDDAAGDINGGDFWTEVCEKFPGISVKEIRIISYKPIEIEKDTD